MSVRARLERLEAAASAATRPGRWEVWYQDATDPDDRLTCEDVYPGRLLTEDELAAHLEATGARAIIVHLVDAAEPAHLPDPLADHLLPEVEP